MSMHTVLAGLHATTPCQGQLCTRQVKWQPQNWQQSGILNGRTVKAPTPPPPPWWGILVERNCTLRLTESQLYITKKFASWHSGVTVSVDHKSTPPPPLSQAGLPLLAWELCTRTFTDVDRAESRSHTKCIIEFRFVCTCGT